MSGCIPFSLGYTNLVYIFPICKFYHMTVYPTACIMSISSCSFLQGVSSISFLVYLLPVESGEKVSLSTTVMLSYFVLLLMMADITPRSSATTPIICKIHVQLYVQGLITGTRGNLKGLGNLHISHSTCISN